jgi:hypothetical protein
MLVDSPAGGGEAVGRRVGVERARPGRDGDGLGGELPALAEAGVRGRVADAERDEAAALLAGVGEELPHDAPDGRLALRQRRVAPHCGPGNGAMAVSFAALLLRRSCHLSNKDNS